MKRSPRAGRRKETPGKIVIGVKIDEPSDEQKAALKKIFRCVAVAIVGPSGPVGIDKRLVARRKR